MSDIYEQFDRELTSFETHNEDFQILDRNSLFNKPWLDPAQRGSCSNQRQGSNKSVIVGSVLLEEGNNNQVGNEGNFVFLDDQVVTKVLGELELQPAGNNHFTSIGTSHSSRFINFVPCDIDKAPVQTAVGHTETPNSGSLNKTGRKQRRSSRLMQTSDYKKSADYLLVRERNNKAVKKCREQMRHRRQQIDEELKQLKAENQQLRQIIHQLMSDIPAE